MKVFNSVGGAQVHPGTDRGPADDETIVPRAHDARKFTATLFKRYPIESRVM